MTTIACMIDVVQDTFGMSVSGETGGKDASLLQAKEMGMKSVLMGCYFLFALVLGSMYDFAWRPSWGRGWNGFSFVYFVGSCVQCLGFISLCMQVRAKKTVAGISSQSLTIFALSLMCRVFTTMVYDGYLPIDKSGDIWAQAMDGCSLAIVLHLLYLMHKTYAHTYEEEHDAMSIKPILIACLTSAFFIRADLNHDPLYDGLWALGLNLEIFQMLPQLYMLAKVGGTVHATTAHYVVNIFIACICRFAFWIWALPGCKELAGEEKRYSLNMSLGGFYILGAYILECLVYLDFIYYYVRALLNGQKSVYLPKDSGYDDI